ncbi:hypothetical protein GGR58DRAFT_389264 [Xylaria digitata]|nr:hypothetical protein GGR58DRAFT_389264 [Xylaria digitata]
MSSTYPLTAPGSDITRRPASSLSDPTLPVNPSLLSRNSDTRFNAASATTTSTITTTKPSRTNADGLNHPPQSTTSSCDVGTDISQRPASTPIPPKKERAKVARKDAVSAVSKETIKEPRNSRDSIKDLKEQRAASNGRTSSSTHPSASVDPLSHVRRELSPILLVPTTATAPAGIPLFVRSLI